MTKGSTTGTVTLKDAATSYTLKKSGSNLIAKAKSSAQLPSEDYWFEQDTAKTDSLSEIMITDPAVDLQFDDVAETFKPKFENVGSARHLAKK